MAREIDLDNISPEDIEYIKQRPWLLEDAERYGYKIDLDAGAVQSPAFSQEEVGQDHENEVHGQDESSEDDYDDWTVDELKEELDNRELKTSGKKPELIDRLREDDATEE